MVTLCVDTLGRWRQKERETWTPIDDLANCFPRCCYGLVAICIGHLLHHLWGEVVFSSLSAEIYHLHHHHHHLTTIDQSRSMDGWMDQLTVTQQVLLILNFFLGGDFLLIVEISRTFSSFICFADHF